MSQANSAAIDKADLLIFEHQVAGHGDILYTKDKKVLVKPLNARENKFYQGAASQPLKKFIPAYHGTICLNNEETSKPTEPATQDTHICIENLSADYVSPSIMDIKIGTQLYDLDATAEKKIKMKLHAEKRTSAEIGFALSGLVFAGHPPSERPWLHALTKETVVTDAFVPFFGIVETSLGAEHRNRVVQKIIDWLVEYRSVVQVSETRMYGSSLLVLLESNKERMLACKDKRDLVTVKAIDFAHSHWIPDEGADGQYLFGLDNLIHSLKKSFK